MIYLEHREGTSYIWEEADLRMMPDDFGTLQVVPFCWFEHDIPDWSL